MPETKHTPGPWRLNKYGSIGAGEFGTNPIVATVEPFYGPDNRHGSHAANACLIAAAPELLAALENIVAALFEPQPALTRAALDAIAKAKGDDNV